MSNEFLQNLMANNIQVLEDFYKKEKLETLDEEDENVSKNKKINTTTVVLDWLSLNAKENEQFLKIEAKAEKMKNGTLDSDDEFDYDSDSSDGNCDNDDNSDKSSVEEAQSLEDDEDDENLTEKQKLEIHDKLIDKQEKQDEEDESEQKYDELSKYYCYRILIEFIRELKNYEDKINNDEEYVYRKYEHDDVEEENSFAYKMSNNQIALKTKFENESYISLIMYCFELVHDDKANKLNDIRQNIIQSSIDFDNKYISRIKKMKTMSVQNWFTIIEDSMAIPFGDFVKFEFNYDNSKIVEKTRYEFDDKITEENVENIQFYTVQNILTMYEQKIFENRILAKYN